MPIDSLEDSLDFGVNKIICLGLWRFGPLRFWTLFSFYPKMFVYSNDKYAYISETVHLRHFMTGDEYHYHCIAFNLGYLYLTLSDLRSNQGQIGKNHSKWLITLVYTFELKFVCIHMSFTQVHTSFNNKCFCPSITMLHFLGPFLVILMAILDFKGL